MFKKESHSHLLLAVDSTSKPFWSSGDVLSGSVRLIVDKQISLQNIVVKLECTEKAKVSRNERDREVSNKKNFNKSSNNLRTKKILHFVYHTIVLDIPKESAQKVLTLETGEYIFPFTIDLMDDIQHCPPYAPITTRAGVQMGVEWKLKAVANLKKRADLQAVQLVPVFPKVREALSGVNENGDIELSGDNLTSKPSFLSLFRPKSNGPKPTFHAQLKLSSAKLPQRPNTIACSLNVEAESAEARIYSIQVNLVRCCSVKVNGNVDVYRTWHRLGSVTVTRVVKGAQDLSSLIGKIALPELMASAFSSTLLQISYEIELRIEYVMSPTASGYSDPKLKKLVISTPIDVTEPNAQWMGRAHISGERHQVHFNEAAGEGSGSKSTTTGRTGTTGTTGTSGYSLTSTVGTVNSYEIQRPRQVLSGWLSKLSE